MQQWGKWHHNSLKSLCYDVLQQFTEVQISFGRLEFDCKTKDCFLRKKKSDKLF